MAALDIEFEEEDKQSSASSKKEDKGAEEISLEFSATTELIDLAESVKIEKTGSDNDPNPGNIAFNYLSENSGPKKNPAEISEEMKAAVNKVKAEAAKVRSLDDVRQKRPAPVTAPAKPLAQAQAQGPTVKLAPLAQGVTALQSDVFTETKNLPLLERLDTLTKVEVEAEIRVAQAQTRGEVMSYYLSEAKLLEYQIISLLKRLPVKSQEEIKILQQIQKRLSDNTKKKPNL